MNIPYAIMSIGFLLYSAYQYKTGADAVDINTTLLFAIIALIVEGKRW